MQHLYMGRIGSVLLPMCIASSYGDSCHMPWTYERGSLSDDLLTYVKNLREVAALSISRQSITRLQSRAVFLLLLRS